jgi:hypothetical protein
VLGAWILQGLSMITKFGKCRLCLGSFDNNDKQEEVYSKKYSSIPQNTTEIEQSLR